MNSTTVVVASRTWHTSHSTDLGAELINNFSFVINAHLLFCLDLLRCRFESRLVGCLSDAGTCVISFERFCGLDPEPYGIKRRKKDKREDRSHGGCPTYGGMTRTPKNGLPERERSTTHNGRPA